MVLVPDKEIQRRRRRGGGEGGGEEHQILVVHTPTHSHTQTLTKINEEPYTVKLVVLLCIPNALFHSFFERREETNQLL